MELATREMRTAWLPGSVVGGSLLADEVVADLAERGRGREAPGCCVG